MEKLDTHPHELTSKEFSSRFPFTPPKENYIRLFGKEFGGNDPTVSISNNCSPVASATTTVIHNETKENRESKRSFECHYCSRNFPTSQALGGHQNAHRRERLHAKRTHIPSITIHNSSSKPQLHAYPNHHNRYLTTTSSLPYHHHTSTGSIINYNNRVMFYGVKASYTFNQTPIHGSPLAVSRFPTAVQKLTTFTGGQLLNYSTTGSSSRRLYRHESKPSFNHDQVSLDLHL